MENVVPVDEEAKPKTDGNYAAVVPDFGTTDLTKSEYLVFWKSRPPTYVCLSKFHIHIFIFT